MSEFDYEHIVGSMLDNFSSEGWIPGWAIPSELEMLVKKLILDLEIRERLAYEQGRGDGYEEGHRSGHAEGYGEGYEEAYEDGSRNGYRSGHDDGWADGNDDGYSNGYDVGYEDGFRAASA